MSKMTPARARPRALPAVTLSEHDGVRYLHLDSIWIQGGMRIRKPQVVEIDYVQRTQLMRFPDLVSVRFYDLAGGQSSIAIYSRSVYGYSDMGTNRRRVERWLARLRAELTRG